MHVTPPTSSPICLAHGKSEELGLQHNGEIVIFKSMTEEGLSVEAWLADVSESSHTRDSVVSEGSAYSLVQNEEEAVYDGSNNLNQKRKQSASR
jgi:hypothetical protein